MKQLLTSDLIYIKESNAHNAGRGVFAKRDIKNNIIIEKCPTIVVPKDDLSRLNESVLVTYFFYFGKNKEQLIIALGFGSIYNHCDNPNAAYKIKPLEKLIEFKAIKDIKKGSEITINYKNKNSKINRPLWFEAISQTNLEMF